jgi:hypothetical protein
VAGDDAGLFTERVFPGVPEVTVAARARASGRPDGVHLHRQAHQPGAAARSAAAS